MEKDKPNWKNAADYAYTKKLDAAGWAWEFLRRNKKYRKDYQALVSGAYTTVSCEPPKKAGETDKQWVVRCIQEDVEPNELSPELTLARKWGLKWSLRDPLFNAIELKTGGKPVEFDPGVVAHFPRIWDELLNVPTVEEEGGVTVVRRDRLVAVLDLTGPMTPQLANLRNAFQSAKASMTADGTKQGMTSKPKQTAFLQGIRALDALDKKESPHKIGKVLFEGDAADLNVKIADCIKSATKNRDSGYLAIARRRKPVSDN